MNGKRRNNKGKIKERIKKENNFLKTRNKMTIKMSHYLLKKAYQN
jgi:hypothetical protein